MIFHRGRNGKTKGSWESHGGFLLSLQRGDRAHPPEFDLAGQGEIVLDEPLNGFAERGAEAVGQTLAGVEGERESAGDLRHLVEVLLKDVWPIAPDMSFERS